MGLYLSHCIYCQRRQPCQRHLHLHGQQRRLRCQRHRLCQCRQRCQRRQCCQHCQHHQRLFSNTLYHYYFWSH